MFIHFTNNNHDGKLLGLKQLGFDLKKRSTVSLRRLQKNGRKNPIHIADHFASSFNKVRTPHKGCSGGTKDVQ